MTEMRRAYRAWCMATFDDYKTADFPFRGRMYEVWCAAWHAAHRSLTKGETQ